MKASNERPYESTREFYEHTDRLGGSVDTDRVHLTIEALVACSEALFRISNEVREFLPTVCAEALTQAEEALSLIGKKSHD